MSYSYIEIEKNDRIQYIILSRQEKKNALNYDFVTELKDALQAAENDNSTKVIIIKAKGNVFSAGADLEYLQQLQNFSFEENLADSNHLKDLFLHIYTSKKVVIAQVEGHAIAGGCGLATVCDFCFAVPDAKFGYTEVKIGFIPALVMVFLIRKINGSKAKELLLTGKLIGANEAAAIGLINAVADQDRIEIFVKDFATALCNEASAQSIAATKEMLNKISSMDLSSALDYAARMNANTRASEDCKKGIESFLKKEKINW
ncbi:MAG: enoyl-CoA hydratase/isomerase family protein [Chitinophagales bacterium]|nr:enoyl-CoA hydratase/isomerase family protein [Chitinophagales bacterium]